MRLALVFFLFFPPFTLVLLCGRLVYWFRPVSVIPTANEPAGPHRKSGSRGVGVGGVAVIRMQGSMLTAVTFSLAAAGSRRASGVICTCRLAIEIVKATTQRNAPL